MKKEKLFFPEEMGVNKLLLNDLQCTHTQSDRFEYVLSLIKKMILFEELEIDEVHCAANTLWELVAPPKNYQKKIKNVKDVVFRPYYLFYIPLFLISITNNLSANALFGLYKSIKDQMYFGEEKDVGIPPKCVSSVGSGGKEIFTINVSSASAIIAASCGLNVIRSGTRKVFGANGANNFLTENSIPYFSDLIHAKSVLENTGLVFLDGEKFSSLKLIQTILKFFPGYKSFLKIISTPLRQVNNLMNPMNSQYVFRGISMPITYEVAFALKEYKNISRGVVAFSKDKFGRAFDEISIFGPTEITEINNNSLLSYELNPFDVGLSTWKVQDIEIDDPYEGYKVINEIFQGLRGEGDPITELLVINSATLLYAGNVVDNISEGVSIIMDTISNGKPWNFLLNYKTFINRQNWDLK